VGCSSAQGVAPCGKTQQCARSASTAAQAQGGPQLRRCIAATMLCPSLFKTLAMIFKQLPRASHCMQMRAVRGLGSSFRSIGTLAICQDSSAFRGLMDMRMKVLQTDRVYECACNCKELEGCAVALATRRSRRSKTRQKCTGIVATLLSHRSSLPLQAQVIPQKPTYDPVTTLHHHLNHPPPTPGPLHQLWRDFNQSLSRPHPLLLLLPLLPLPLPCHQLLLDAVQGVGWTRCRGTSCDGRLLKKRPLG